MKINNCPNCGSKAVLDSGVFEYSEKRIQEISIYCDNDECHYTLSMYMLSMTLNPEKITQEMERKLIELWNNQNENQ